MLDWIGSHVALVVFGVFLSLAIIEAVVRLIPG